MSGDMFIVISQEQYGYSIIIHHSVSCTFLFVFGLDGASISNNAGMATTIITSLEYIATLYISLALSVSTVPVCHMHHTFCIPIYHITIPIPSIDLSARGVAMLY